MVSFPFLVLFIFLVEPVSSLSLSFSFKVSIGMTLFPFIVWGLVNCFTILFSYWYSVPYSLYLYPSVVGGFG